MSQTEKTKDITYKIVIPEDRTVTGDDILDNSDLKTRTSGYCGENLVLWLVAVWGEEASYLGKVDWESNIFNCELTNTKSEKNVQHVSTNVQHVSTNEINPLTIQYKSVVRRLSAAVPLQIALLHTPATETQLTIWKDDFATQVISMPISITLPVIPLTTIKVEVDTIAIFLDFSSSSCEVNSFDLHFAPQLKISLSDYEKAFALRRVANSSKFILSVASSESIRLLKNIQFALSVFWGDNTMMSHFIIEMPMPASHIGLLWIVPNLQKLKQTPLAVEITNITSSPLDISLELDDRPCIPLIKTIKVQHLEPNERRTVDVPCVPCVSGIHELTYRLKIGNQWFKPMFKTIVKID
jgi:hypothetical protein